MLAMPRHELPKDKEHQLNNAKLNEWITIGFTLSIILVMYLAMGSSQAMKTAWVEDLFTLVPPVGFLVSIRVARRPPNERYPYGYHRAVTIAFLCGSVALLGVGLALLFDGARNLITREHPTIGAVHLGSHTIWLGWLMILALIYSAIAPFILGKLKIPLANGLHDKTLFADARMNVANWKTALAAIAGIVGIGAGFWWADAAAACFISFDITRDGFRNVSTAVADLMNRRPMSVDEKQQETLPADIITALEAFDYVEAADVRLRDEGHVFMGEAFVVLRDERDTVARIAELVRAAHNVDWRVYGLTVMPVSHLKMPEDTP